MAVNLPVNPNQKARHMDSVVHGILVDTISNADFSDNLFLAGRMALAEIWGNMTHEWVIRFSILMLQWNTQAPLRERFTVAAEMSRMCAEVRNSLFLRDFPEIKIPLTGLTNEQIIGIIGVMRVMQAKSAAENAAINRPQREVSIADLEEMIITKIVPRSFMTIKPGVGSWYMRYKAILRANNLLTAQMETDADKIVRDFIQENSAHAGMMQPLQENAQNNGVGLQIGNAFMIDPLVHACFLFKRCSLTYVQLTNFLRNLSIFSFSSNVGRKAQKQFWHAHYRGTEVWRIRTFIHEAQMTVYDNPYKCTFKRLTDCAAAVYPTVSELGLLMIKDRQKKCSVIATICTISLAEGVIQNKAGTTSTAEHLLHQLMATGCAPLNAWNKNFLVGSTENKVDFVIGQVNGPVAGDDGGDDSDHGNLGAGGGGNGPVRYEKIGKKHLALDNEEFSDNDDEDRDVDAKRLKDVTFKRESFTGFMKSMTAGADEHDKILMSAKNNRMPVVEMIKRLKGQPQEQEMNAWLVMSFIDVCFQAACEWKSIEQAAEHMLLGYKQTYVKPQIEQKVKVAMHATSASVALISSKMFEVAEPHVEVIHKQYSNEIVDLLKELKKCAGDVSALNVRIKAIKEDVVGRDDHLVPADFLDDLTIPGDWHVNPKPLNIDHAKMLAEIQKTVQHKSKEGIAPARVRIAGPINPQDKMNVMNSFSIPHNISQRGKKLNSSVVNIFDSTNLLKPSQTSSSLYIQHRKPDAIPNIPTEKKPNSFTKEFKVGDMLRVSSNEKLIQEKQQHCGGYSKMRMHDLIGKLVVVKHFSIKCVKVEKDGKDYDLHPDILDYPKADYKPEREIIQRNKPEEISDKNTLLISAISSGDLEKLFEAIDVDNLNSQIIQGKTPINLACCLGKKDIVERLMDLGADLKCPDNDGNYPIHNCLLNGFDSIFKLLLENNPDNLNVKTQRGLSLLNIARNKQNKEIENYLLTFNRNENENNLSYETSLEISLPLPPLTMTKPNIQDPNYSVPQMYQTTDITSLMHLSLDEKTMNSRQATLEFDTIPVPTTVHIRSSMVNSNPTLNDLSHSIENECTICRDNQINTVFVKCGHVACKRCADKIVVCHICKADIEDRLNVYF